jgi:hypothetical protein
VRCSSGGGELPVYGRAFLLRALVKTERNDQARALAASCWR